MRVWVGGGWVGGCFDQGGCISRTYQGFVQCFSIGVQLGTDYLAPGCFQL
jgi:hypothetical protein